MFCLLRLAIFGASNGGLLTAVCSQQRPDLFGAVITQLGLLDMLRFNKLGIGSDWVSEYGDPDNATDFSYIYKYSPLQQLSVTPGKQWPATLLLSADHDDLVDVSHTLKYTAQLYHLLRTNAESWQRNPVVAKILVDQGHAFTGTPTEKKIKEKVDIYTFIARALGLKWTE
uniref:Prolyl endopeptidase n=1 Tax=Heterodera glycines TaxID=51029 RepID=A0A0E3JCP3_HETGL|nr:esophageal gland-localized secretory protein 14 [Heterodera glycines]